MKNAKFWTYLNDGMVRIKIKPFQTLRWSSHGRDEEGWTSEFESWTHGGDRIISQCGTDGTDCDGRHSRFWQGFATLDKLAARQCYTDPTLRIPEWTQSNEEQRDYTAEAAGY